MNHMIFVLIIQLYSWNIKVAISTAKMSAYCYVSSKTLLTLEFEIHIIFTGHRVFSLGLNI